MRKFFRGGCVKEHRLPLLLMSSLLTGPLLAHCYLHCSCIYLYINVEHLFPSLSIISFCLYLCLNELIFLPISHSMCVFYLYCFTTCISCDGQSGLHGHPWLSPVVPALVTTPDTAVNQWSRKT